ncbi:hypothetical protein [Ligilactobacillus acidipiscis]|nr:hypothetical protein [Ligilactobacillus acidipiscis]
MIRHSFGGGAWIVEKSIRFHISTLVISNVLAIGHRSEKNIR